MTAHPYDESCDCNFCETHRDETCPRCGEPWAWDGDTERSRVCASCLADEAEARREAFE